MTGRFLGLVCVTALLAGCSGSGPHYSARMLQRRLYANLAPELSLKQAAIQKMRDGALVTLSEPALFDYNSTILTPHGQFALSSMTESLLDPRLMQVSVRGAPETPSMLRDLRTQTVRQFVEAFSLGPPLPIAAHMQPASGAPAQGLTVEIHVVCPPGPQGSTWKYQVAGATCD